MKNLTQRRVRKIDYWYLGAASIGMLVFAISYAEQREALFGKATAIAFHLGEQKYIDDTISKLRIFQNRICAPTVMRLSTKPCDEIQPLIDELKPDLSASKIKDIASRFTNIARAYTALYPYEVISKVENFFLPQAIVQVQFDNWLRYAESAPRTQLTKRDEEFELLFGFGQIVIWPFILAFALALRITKVTIDVFEWAK